MATNPKPYLSPEEYLKLERQADFKSEYQNGEMLAMSGASENHVLLVTNLVMEIGQKLRRGPCRVYSNDMRVWIESRQHYTYPNLAVVCSKPIFTDDEFDTLTNPDLLIEVLSRTTADYDRGRKFSDYRTIPSLKEYLTVAQDSVHIEQHVLTDGGGWLLTDHDDVTGTIHLASVHVTLALADIYEVVDRDQWMA